MKVCVPVHVHLHLRECVDRGWVCMCVYGCACVCVRETNEFAKFLYCGSSCVHD